ncbi:hypothetical protein PN597_19250, partial [Parabacteroides merdae]|uniref:hypothetical protein n=1 Tax=Parabacteroides merdae TaxID=46503 RepID=UPI00232BDD4F
ISHSNDSQLSLKPGTDGRLTVCSHGKPLCFIKICLMEPTFYKEVLLFRFLTKSFLCFLFKSECYESIK